jgi:hypothetical protein
MFGEDRSLIIAERPWGMGFKKWHLKKGKRHKMDGIIVTESCREIFVGSPGAWISLADLESNSIGIYFCRPSPISPAEIAMLEEEGWLAGIA